jgi:hypothetical protein
MALRKNFGSGRSLQTKPFGVGFPLPPFMRHPDEQYVNAQNILLVFFDIPVFL